MKQKKKNNLESQLYTNTEHSLEYNVKWDSKTFNMCMLLGRKNFPSVQGCSKWDKNEIYMR